MSHPGRDIANFSADDRKRKNEEQQEESNKKLKKEQNWEMDFNDWSGHIESELKDEDVIRLENIQKKEVADYIKLIRKADVFDDDVKNNITILRTEYYIDPYDLMFMIGRQFGPDGCGDWTDKKYNLLKQIFSFMNEKWQVSEGDTEDFISQMCGEDGQPLYFSVVRAAYYANALPSDVSTWGDHVAAYVNCFLEDWGIPVDSYIEKYKSGALSDDDTEFGDEYDTRMIRKLIRMHVWLQSIQDKSDEHSWDTYRV